MRNIIFDVETNGLINPSKIWVVVCKDIETEELFVFRNLTEDLSQANLFKAFALEVNLWVGHNSLAYDLPVLYKLVSLPFVDTINCIDTYLISKLVDYPRSGHSIEDYGLEFNLPKGDFHDFSKYSQEMEDYCIRDVDVCHRIYDKYYRYISDIKHRPSITLEHQFQLIVNKLEDKGFMLDVPKAEKLLDKVTTELGILDEGILSAFHPKLKLIREIHPKVTKHGTLSRTDFRFLGSSADLTEYNGGPFSRCAWVSFNPGSPKQVVSVLNDSGWQPVEKTKGHIETERKISKLKRSRERSKELDTALTALYTALNNLKIYGWKVNENNLLTLPPTASDAARTLARRILFESRRKTLTEWLGLADPLTSRVHGKFQGIGAWTHRMSHQKPNMANITNEFDTAGKVKLLGKELRQCWRAPKGRLLTGVDAEGIQLRIFAHYVNNEELIKALVNGDKKLKTDPHSYNQRVLGDVCKSRAAAKRFLYALFLGAGIDKLANILECRRPEAELALESLLLQYPGFQELKDTIIPSDARRGWFTGIDGRKVRIPGDDAGTRRHLAMSGYLQNGEAVVMKTAAVIAEPQLAQFDSFIVDIVHDEAQNETPNNIEVCLEVAEVWNKAIVEAGERYSLKCPMAGSYINDHGKYTIGTNWYQTH